MAQERKEYILKLLMRDGKVKVLPLAEQLEVSSETIRRDLDVLESEGRLRRVYGGAILSTYVNGEPPFQQRAQLHEEEKKAIGTRAAELIEDGDVIALDVGTTMLELARAIQGKRNLTILSNSLPIASCLSEALNNNRFTGKVILLGGEVNPAQQSMTGPICEQVLRQFHLDKAFLSIGGISLQRGITDYDLNEAYISKLLANAAKDVIVLADQSKIGVQAFAHILPLEQVDCVVSNYPYPEEWKAQISKLDLHWIVCGTMA